MGIIILIYCITEKILVHIYPPGSPNLGGVIYAKNEFWWNRSEIIYGMIFFKYGS